MSFDTDQHSRPDPAARLASRWWRLRHSAWLLAPILGCGFLSGIGFLYTALRVRTRKFWIALVVAGLASTACIALMELYPDEEPALVSLTWWVCYLGMIVYAFVLNRDYLRWRARRTAADAWYNQPLDNAGPPSLAPPPVGSSPVPTAARVEPARLDPVPVWGSAESPLPGAVENTRDLVDADTASVAELAAALDGDVALAARIVTARNQYGRLSSIDDLVAAAGLQPHELVKVRGRLTVAPLAGQDRPAALQPESPSWPPPGRVLDY
ncbi:MAG: helix-hairpin-helix domain-containing protein [Micrococcales bacterium]|nr:helix-hairpin-helix domain-containing protein [Micrococcales bacterium]